MKAILPIANIKNLTTEHQQKVTELRVGVVGLALLTGVAERLYGRAAEGVGHYLGALTRKLVLLRCGDAQQQVAWK